ncbi:Mth938-like domain-containing protein [Sphingomonas japonica]|uniref:Uncharacterized protein n=1 Tax=Sphingomonas japonica TaxID=511662 RepID=A0ABX0TWM7_9SPHN|nr:Mth938-like domain-containing protein [Sphingomonas japonica]NIJ22726.1 uncharacterized protein [Sphingomonas japonica]
MRIDKAGPSEGPLIAAIVGRGFKVDDGVYEGLTITPLRADAWSPPPLAELGIEALAPLLAIDPAPEFILLGTGSSMRRPPRALIEALDARGIGLEFMDSRAAARAWGVLRAELRWIAAALYPLD